MADLIFDEMQLFLVCLLLGALLALAYDGVRIFRLLFHHKNWLVDVEDLCFWIFTAWIVFRTLFFYNQGALRGYAFFGMFLGVILYEATISRLLLYGVRRMIPYWNRFKKILLIPIEAIKRNFRKALKNIAIEVKMAIKGR